MKKSIVLSIVVILILLFSVIFLFIQNQSLEKEISILNNNISELEKNKPEPVKPEPITDKIPEGWKEYVDEEYKFRIWYPEEFTGFGQNEKVRVEKLINNYDIKDNWIKEIQIYMPITNDIPIGLMAIYIYESNLNIQDYVKNDVEKAIESSSILKMQNKDPESYIAKIESNGFDLYKFEISTQSFIKYYAKKDDKIFVLAADYDGAFFDSTPGLEKTFNQMAYSLEFIK